MNDVRRLCQSLLNGPPDRCAVNAAGRHLDEALAGVTRQPANHPPAGGANWRCARELADTAKRAGPALLHALAPPMLLDGVWLARAALPATAHQPEQGRLLRIYAETVGLEQPAQSPPLRYRARLVQAGVDLPALTSPLFFADARLPESALRFALLHLALLHRPVRYFPELLGYTLAHLSREPEAFDDPVVQPLRRRHQAWAQEAYTLASAAGVSEARLQRGWALYIAYFEALLRDGLSPRLRWPSGADAMAAVVRSKLPQALGYHRHVMLQGQPLDAWLSEQAANPAPLLRALRDSPFANPACPVASRLIQAMDFGGPMFGVFSGDERMLALAWLADPGAPAAHAPFTPGAESSGLRRRAAAPAHGEPAGALQAGGRRSLYLALLNAESPALSPSAGASFIHRVLRRARILGWLGLGPRRLAWSPAALREFAARRHADEVKRYRPQPGPPRVDKAFCRWVLRQLAPAILVDGAWLAGIPHTAEHLGAAGRRLLGIYVDELGAGRADWNHPNVYRRLLDSQGIRLPAFDSADFARSAGFMTAAFEIPVYLLAMGLNVRRFRPELLGLNLAIELSGLGAAYLRAIDILRQHGMDPTIVQLHLSIDNLASGHAARACEAIELYLDEVGEHAGPDAVDQVWRRIWLGYGSLQAVSLGLSLRIIGRYLLHRLGLRVASATPG